MDLTIKDLEFYQIADDEVKGGKRRNKKGKQRNPFDFKVSNKVGKTEYVAIGRVDYIVSARYGRGGAAAAGAVAGGAAGSVGGSPRAGVGTSVDAGTFVG